MESLSVKKLAKLAELSRTLASTAELNDFRSFRNAFGIISLSSYCMSLCKSRELRSDDQGMLDVELEYHL